MIIYFVFVILYKFSNGIEIRWMSVLLRWDYLMPNTNHTCHHMEVYDLTAPPCIITNRIWNILFTTLSQPPWIIIENLPPKFQNRWLSKKTLNVECLNRALVDETGWTQFISLSAVLQKLIIPREMSQSVWTS